MIKPKSNYVPIMMSPIYIVFYHETVCHNCKLINTHDYRYKFEMNNNILSNNRDTFNISPKITV